MSTASAASPSVGGLELRQRAYWAHFQASRGIAEELERHKSDWIYDTTRSRKDVTKAIEEKVDRLLKVQKAASDARLSALSPTIAYIQKEFSGKKLQPAKKAYAYNIFCKEVPKGRVDVCRWFLDLLGKGDLWEMTTDDDSPPHLVYRMTDDDSLRINKTFLRTIRNGVEAWERVLLNFRAKHIVMETLSRKAAVSRAKELLKATRKDIQSWIASSLFDGDKLLSCGAELAKREDHLRMTKIDLKLVPERAKAMEQHPNAFVANFPFSEACVFLWSTRNLFYIEEKKKLDMTPYGSSKIPKELFFHSVERLHIYEIKIDRPEHAFRAPMSPWKPKVYPMPAPGLHGTWGWSAY